MSADALTTMEHAALVRCEETIQKGLQTFLEVGQALAMIRDQRLYRASHATFTDYCQSRWGIVASRARQLMRAAEVVENIQSGTTVPLLPTNESQVRPLVPLPPAQQAAVWEEVVATGKRTGAAVEQAARKAYTPAYLPPSRTETLRLLAAKQRILMAAMALLADDAGGVTSAMLAAFDDERIEDAGFRILESSEMARLASRLVATSEARRFRLEAR